MLEACFDLLVPLVMADIIDVGVANGDLRYILLRCGLLLLLAGIGLTCSVTAQYYAAKSAVGFATDLRHSLYSHIQSFGFSETDAFGTDTLITRVSGDVTQMQTALNYFLRLFLRSPFIILGSMGLAFAVNVKSALVFVAVVPLLSLFVFGIMYLCISLYQRVQGKMDSVLGKTRENLTGVRVIRAFNKQESEVREFMKENEGLARLQLKVGRLSNLTNPATYAVVNLAVIAVLYIGAINVNIGSMQQGDVVALISYFMQILIELVKIATLVVLATKGIASSRRIKAVFDTKKEMIYGDSTVENSEEAVAFKNVSFAYEKGGICLDNVSFTVNKGETVGIIGGTGSGKTTLTNLIPRYYDATSGEVLLYGKPIKEYSEKALTDTVSVVLQKARLFEGTIRSNLAFGKSDATDEELYAALGAAQAEDIVTEKGGLDAVVEQGGRNLSGGQKQRLSIARSLVKKSDILILDDSASALDFATDAALRRSLKELKDTTVFIVSQRTSSIKNADRILVLDDGKLIGNGTHDELLLSCPVYREIYDSQFKKAGGENV